MLNKKHTLLISSVITFFNLLSIGFSYSFFDSCYKMLTCQKFVIDPLDSIAPYTLLFVPILLFSLVTYKMREEIFRAWIKFAVWWIPLSMILILISPEYTNDLVLPIVKGTVAMATSAVFIVVSLFIIARKHFAARG